ncbi:hypothetical protein EYF80_000444 [Liparis tanakae]|uniref:Uncharacterized protein n=1 Tax=Liparis tanakae TaxID=230148 RepID=A0A4Z2JFX6_9TELE|nr:hypothetical protein EYF80_000444 [Liparis tanakae]
MKSNSFWPRKSSGSSWTRSKPSSMTSEVRTSSSIISASMPFRARAGPAMCCMLASWAGFMRYWVLSIHGSGHHALPLPHGRLHVGRGATVVHHLAIGQCPHALLVGMLLVTCLQAAIHAHPVTVETGAR